MGQLLENRVAVVTGAGNGLGRAEAIGLAARGAMVVVNDVGTAPDGRGASNSAADQVVAEIKKNGGRAVANYDSVADENAAESIIKTAVDTWGRIDVLVNNAGIVRPQMLCDIKTDDWDAVLKVHLYGTMFCTRAACRIMKQQKYGRIINTSSHCGLGVPMQATYSAAKEGITGFSRTVAREMQEYGINCNVIRPIASYRGIKNGDPAVDANKPEDTAALVIYLASEQADNINGCIFEVWKGHVGLYIDPPPVAQILSKEGSWTPEGLAVSMPQTLTKNKKRDLISSLPSF